jgi:hypothetical protein
MKTESGNKLFGIIFLIKSFSNQLVPRTILHKFPFSNTKFYVAVRD